MDKPLHFDYTEAKAFCEGIGLVWLGDDWIRNADEAAWVEGFSQQQMDVALQHHMVQVKVLFDPRSYRWWQRLALALYFLTGWRPQ